MSDIDLRRPKLIRKPFGQLNFWSFFASIRPQWPYARRSDVSSVVLVLISTCFGLQNVGAQDVRAQAGPRVEVQYDYDAEGYATNPKTAIRRLTGINWIDRSGRSIERIDIEENNGSPRYIRNVFTYDRAGRKTAHLEYASEVLPSGREFTTSRARAGIKLLPVIADSVKFVSIFEYDTRGNMLEMRKTDGDGLLLHKINYVYDTRGRQIKYLNQDGIGKTLCESTSVYTQGGRMHEQRFGECEINHVRRIVYLKDAAGREIREEQYSRSRAGDPRLVMTSLALSSYSGNERTLNWTLWNTEGEPTTKLIIVDRGEEEASRKEFRPVEKAEAAGTCVDATIKCGWVPDKESFREYTYDKAGNLVREAEKTRSAPGEPFRLTYLIERVIY